MAALCSLLNVYALLQDFTLTERSELLELRRKLMLHIFVSALSNVFLLSGSKFHRKIACKTSSLHLQYRPNVSWQSFARRVSRLDPRFSILARIEDRGSSRASSLSRIEKVMSLSLDWFLEKLILLINPAARTSGNCSSTRKGKLLRESSRHNNVSKFTAVFLKWKETSY